jgi:UDP-N-acetylmuramate--L-alanine ligase/UDP-N-acetylenolpyruvoylglucosamine reductase
VHIDAYEHATARLAARPSRAHLVGVGGVGMAGLAYLLSKQGWTVTGCDLCDNPLLAWLAGEGIATTVGHSPNHAAALDPASDLVARSPAVPRQNPELAAAAARGIPVYDRGVLFAALLDRRPKAIAVCGSHGKTTTASFTAMLLRDLGHAPGWCIGGTASALGALAANGGAQDAPIVAECDESDGTLALYHPYVTVVTNIDFDHMEHFDSVAAFEAVFARVARGTQHLVVYGRDDERAHAICSALPHAFPVGLHAEARLRATDVRTDATGSDFTLFLDDESLGPCRLGHPGLHNVRNALAALGAVHAVGGDLRQAAARLATGLSLPARRFDGITRADGIRVISDYAHHPTEIAALVATARLQPHSRLVAVFQPHRYTRTKALGAQFPQAFAGVDALALAPVYAASEDPLAGGTSADLYAHFRASAYADPTIPVPALAPTLDAAWQWLRATVKPGDLILIIGAGDVVTLARRAADCTALQQPPLAPPSVAGLEFTSPVSCAKHTTYGVGGPARGLACVATLDALRAVIAWCQREALPWTVIGGGSNLLVPDTGYPGVLLQLRGPAFRELRLEEPPQGEGPHLPRRVVVGAGIPGGAMLDQLQELGLRGLEFMDGIPGTLGGWLAMNAGAHGGAIGNAVVEVDVLARDGSRRAVRPPELEFAYRRCEALRGVAILSATLELQPATGAEIAERRRAFRARRTNLSGLRTAGSVFGNPPGESAGRLLDLAGCKGLCVGGADITSRHANVIATQRGATASDVLALAAIAASRVSVPLHMEVRVLDGAL